MDRTERFYKIEMLIRNRPEGAGYVSFNELMSELGVSRATLKRDLEYLRDRLDAPIVYDRFHNGYKFETQAKGAAASAHHLPGVWFSERELHALLTMHQLMSGLDEGGVLSRHVQPILDKVHQMLGSVDGQAEGLLNRVKIASMNRRPVESKYFELACMALTQRKRVEILYFTRSRSSESLRVVSPQRLVHIRNTWYLDAWCHSSAGLRRFALDAIRSAKVVDEAAREVSLKTLEKQLDAGYGAYGGAEVRQATLVFSAEAARWVAGEQWHPDQQADWLPDGRLQLRIPYTDVRELAMEAMRHGADVEVVGDAPLRRHVADKTRLAAAVYERAKPSSRAR
ncbi:WYL domain-containing protein [Variovorax sp. J22R133]|uniref:helix-turn-helix transcriptional regulator n=1 Tax=Variovorax brevis TaxID=3053503 RepID=UPI0025782EB7|nr:WYL domain-containing protein [Variovorax sp. J22R133]MDM0112035.1 WYL domain-containing protein [Variovorax sp. J22R133]